MEWLATILTSPNSWITILGLIALVIIIGFFAKKGLLTLNLKGVKVGSNELELKIVKIQLEQVKADLTDFEVDMRRLISPPKLKAMDPYKAKYVMELVYDAFVDIIALNHIMLDEEYIDAKKNVIWGIVARECPNWAELEEPVKDRTSKMLRALYKIRKYYQNEEAV